MILLFPVHCHHENDRGNSTDNKVCDKELLIHNKNYFNNRMLKTSDPKATSDPMKKTGMLIIPVGAGTKKPMTVDATKIFERSAKKRERVSI